MPQLIPYTLPQELYGAKRVVFKLTFGEDRKKYFIYKALALKTLIPNIAAQIYREVVTPKKASIFFRVVVYYKKFRPGMMHVEVISDPDMNPVELLLFENKALKQAENDPNCLNTAFDNTMTHPKWITDTQMTTFLDLLKGKTPEDKLRKFESYLTKLVKKKDSKDKIVSYIKRNFM